MRLLIFAPEQSVATGNLVTATRLQRGLATTDIEADLVLLPVTNPQTIYRQACLRNRPDAVLLLHAWRTGRAWLACREELPIPAAVLLTGTDIHGGVEDPVQGPVIREVLDTAELLFSQNRLTVAQLKETTWGDKIRLLPPAVVLGDEPYPLRTSHTIPAEAVLFLHPAGIRPVKGNLELLHLCDRLADHHENFRLGFCGPVLDQFYARDFTTALSRRPWAAWFGAIPPAAMPAALREADVILNHSHSEGLPGALLEALAVGRAILARNIPGNAAIIDHDVNGLLYDSDTRFLQQAESLLTCPDLRARLARSPRPDFSPLREAEALRIYLRQLSR